jgi:outer membrane protein OmpA-like peptidoglycan-associated protein
MATPAAEKPAVATPAAPVASLPSMPDAPPPPPVLPGVSSVTIPTPAPVPPPPPPAPPAAPVAGAPIVVAFPPGSSTLPVESLASLKQLSQKRGAGIIAITGYGEATSTDAAAQASAVPLALARARAIATSLLASGVPGAAIRISAEAQGQGGAARVIN